MDEKNNGARRRKAFADFKENQYDSTHTLNATQIRNKTAKKVITVALIIIFTIIFIILGFCFTDSLLTISEKPYVDKNTYTAKYVNTSTTTTESTEGSSADESQSSVYQQSDASQQSSTSQQSSAFSNYQYQTAGNY